MVEGCWIMIVLFKMSGCGSIFYIW